MVDHNILLHKLHKFGFRGIINKWFESYLANRNHVVNVNDVKSQSYVLNIGVPQGSVLGPLLFLIYVNSIFNANLHGNIVAFADDMCLHYSEPSTVDIVNKINADLLTLRRWFDYHHLILSEKTKVMFFKVGYGLCICPIIKYHCRGCTLDNCSNSCIFIE